MGTPKTPTFESLLAKHFGFVRCALWRQHGVPWGDLSDVEQEVWCAVARAFDPKRADDETISPLGWLSRICDVQANRYHGAQYRREHEVSFAHDALNRIASAEPSTEEMIDEASRRALLVALVGGLSPDRRAVIVAHALEDVPMAEVAERFGIRVATAWNRHRCAMADLQAAARRRGRA